MARGRPRVRPRPTGVRADGRTEAGASDPDAAAAEAALHAEHFESYYRTQQICPDCEWPQLLETLHSDLPVAVRVNRGTHMADVLQAQLQRLRAAEGDQQAYAPRPLPWYPHGLAWQWDSLCSQGIRKDSQHKRLKAYLLWLQEHGALTRQEAVSMIPPLCLGVGPGDRVLDLCAAPGSKTSQLIEMMHWDDHESGNGSPRGVVVANEIVAKRADLLTHTLQRLGSPCIVVTQLDGQYFPHMINSAGEEVQFDRVLADVPCSGDGTLRKHSGLWAKWTPRDAVGLHHKQYTLLCRGLDLLRVGGRLVYSTCSFNPVEDEAVVAAALRRYGQSVELVSLPALEGLHGSIGLQTWVVPHPDDAGVCWRRHEDVPTELQQKIPLSAFPAAPGSADAETWAKVCCHCRRFLPHVVLGGGFFVAVLEKTAQAEHFRKTSSCRPSAGPPVKAANDDKCHESNSKDLCSSSRDGELTRDGQGDPAGCSSVAEATGDGDIGSACQGDEESSSAAKAAGNVEDRGDELECAAAAASGADGTNRDCRPVREGKACRGRQQRMFRVGEFEALRPDDPGWMRAAAFFGLDPDLANHLCRREKNPKRLYLVSEEAGGFLQAQAKLKLRVASAGVRILEQLNAGRDGGPPAWRLAQEGLPELLRRGLRRRIAVSRRLLVQLLRARELPAEGLLEAARAGEVEGLERLEASEAGPAGRSEGDVAAAATAERPRGAPQRLAPGSLAVTLLPEAGEERPSTLALAALLSGRVLQAYAPEAEAKAILESFELEMQTAAILYGKAEQGTGLAKQAVAVAALAAAEA